jgi:hypothetical protein
MMASFARAFDVAGFVECDVNMFSIRPQFVVKRELQACCFKGCAGIGNHVTRDANFAIGNQFIAPFACAETLRL